MRRCRSWYRIHQLLQARLPRPPGPLADSLALWLQGMLLAENGCLDRVVAALVARVGFIRGGSATRYDILGQDASTAASPACPSVDTTRRVGRQFRSPPSAAAVRHTSPAVGGAQRPDSASSPRCQACAGLLHLRLSRTPNGYGSTHLNNRANQRPPCGTPQKRGTFETPGVSTSKINVCHSHFLSGMPTLNLA